MARSGRIVGRGGNRRELGCACAGATSRGVKDAELAINRRSRGWASRLPAAEFCQDDDSCRTSLAGFSSRSRQPNQLASRNKTMNARNHSSRLWLVANNRQTFGAENAQFAYRYDDISGRRRRHIDIPSTFAGNDALFRLSTSVAYCPRPPLAGGVGGSNPSCGTIPQSIEIQWIMPE
jgi:hypothetical protein